MRVVQHWILPQVLPLDGHISFEIISHQQREENQEVSWDLLYYNLKR